MGGHGVVRTIYPDIRLHSSLAAGLEVGRVDLLSLACFLAYRVNAFFLAMYQFL